MSPKPIRRVVCVLTALLIAFLAPALSNLDLKVVFLRNQFSYAAHSHVSCELMDAGDTDVFHNLKFSAVNCNSLNLSSSNKPAQMRKIYAITKLKSDIIFLSDIRLQLNNKQTWSRYPYFN